MDGILGGKLQTTNTTTTTTTFTFIDRRNIGNIGSSGYKGKGSHEKIRFLFLAHFFFSTWVRQLGFLRGS
jgi:hypothetical protein